MSDEEKSPSSADGAERARSRGERESDSREKSGDSNRGSDEPRGEKSSDDKKDKKPKRPPKKLIAIGAIVLVVLLIGGVLYYLHARNFISTDDAYTAGHVHDISARVAGTVETVNVLDNRLVKAGQVLLTLDPRDFKLAVEKAEAGLQQARAQVEQRRAAVNRAEADLQKAQSDFDRTTGLFRKDFKAVSKAEVDNVTAARANAQAALDAAHADLVTAEAGGTNGQAAVDDAKLQLSYTTIVAPVDGRVAKKGVETGKQVQPGQALMAVVEARVWVLANYKETQLAKVRIGQHVEVKIDAVPKHVFSAHVDSLQSGTGSSFALLPPDNATGNFTKIVQRVPVKIVFDSFDGFEDRVVPGLSCVPKIDLRSKEDDNVARTTSR